jgi:signal transduction histidine kinase
LQEVLEAAQDHPNYSERQVSLTILQHPLPLSMISGDRGLLWLACFNLLDNALKFSPPGAKIEVRAFEVHPWIMLEFADNGLGIPETDLPHIFEELYRGENAHGLSGSGLGLALARTIAALHAGTITVRSELGQGTIFTMRLPIAA